MSGAAVKRAGAGGVSIRDRLSALPDELLLRVLSFLPAQQVVRATVLSKTWTDLWRYVPGINLNFSDFQSNYAEDWTAVWERMDDFVNNLLMLHRAPSLDAFRLVTVVEVHDDRRRQVDRWVRRAIKDNPLMLEICLGGFSSLQLPYLSSSPCRRLRSLHLIGVSLDHSFVEHLHSWWPDLKDLTLRHCHTVFCCIESDRLENLVVFNCIDQPVDVFAIRAPRLASLSVLLCIPFSLDAVSLVRASISWKGKPEELSPRNGAMLLRSLFNVTSFEWETFQAMAVLDEVFDGKLIFHNLRTLSLKSGFINSAKSGVCELKALGRFLHKSPNLEKLTLKNFKVVPVVEHVDFPVLENLRTLCLHFCGLHDNFQILLQCLRNSPNLEKVNIWHCNLSDDSMGGKGKAKSKKTSSQSRRNLAGLRCLKLEYAEIRHYKEDAGVRELVSILLDFAAPTITIKVSP